MCCFCTQALVLTPRSRCPIVSNKGGRNSGNPYPGYGALCGAPSTPTCQSTLGNSSGHVEELSRQQTISSVPPPCIANPEGGSNTVEGQPLVSEGVECQEQQQPGNRSNMQLQEKVDNSKSVPDKEDTKRFDEVLVPCKDVGQDNCLKKSAERKNRVSLLRRNSTLKRKNKSESNIFNDVKGVTRSASFVKRENMSKSLSNISSALRRSFKRPSKSSCAEKIAKSPALAPTIDEVDFCPQGSDATAFVSSPSIVSQLRKDLEKECIASSSPYSTASPSVRARDFRKLRGFHQHQRDYRYSSSTSQALGSFFKHLSSSSLAQIAERLKTCNTANNPPTLSTPLSPIASDISNTSIKSPFTSPSQTSHNESLSMVFREYLASRSIVTSNENLTSCESDPTIPVQNHEKSRSVPLLEEDSLYLSADEGLGNERSHRDGVRSLSCDAINAFSVAPPLPDSLFESFGETSSHNVHPNGNMTESLLRCLDTGTPPESNSPTSNRSQNCYCNPEEASNASVCSAVCPNFVSVYQLGPLVNPNCQDPPPDNDKENKSPNVKKDSSPDRKLPSKTDGALVSCSPDSRSQSVLGTKHGTPKRAGCGANSLTPAAKVHFETSL